MQKKDTNIIDRIWRSWLAVGEFVGDVVSFFVLTAMYILVITPIGLLYRLSNALGRNKKTSNWQKRQIGGSIYEPY